MLLLQCNYKTTNDCSEFEVAFVLCSNDTDNKCRHLQNSTAILTLGHIR